MSEASCLVRRAGERFSDEIACVDGEDCYTFAQLDAEVNAVSAGLIRHGLSSGDRVAFVTKQDWFTLVTLFSILRGGAIACPLSPRLPEAALRQAAGQVGAKRLKGVRTLFRPRTLDGDHAGRKRVLTPLSPHLATIVFSSGSTGAPKPIVHDLQAHITSAEGANENMMLGPSDRWLWSLPACHVGGLAILFRCLLAGAAVVTTTGIHTFADNLSNYGITHLSLVTTQLKRLLASAALPAPTLKAVLLGGSALPRQLIEAAHDAGVPLRTTYGLSETASQVTATPAHCAGAKRWSAGRALRGREVKIDTGGEILVRGQTLCRGYYRDGGVEPVVDAEGWFHTGDLGVLDDDGYLSVTGRRDNMFISGGENIHPEEIEAHLLGINGVRNAIVVPVNDDEYGQRPVAFVDAVQIDAHMLDERLLDYLPKFKLPIAYHAWPLQTQGSGIKPSRSDLKAMAGR